MSPPEQIGGTHHVCATDGDDVILLRELEEFSILHTSSDGDSHLTALPCGIGRARRGLELLVEDSLLQVVCPNPDVSI